VHSNMGRLLLRIQIRLHRPGLGSVSLRAGLNLLNTRRPHGRLRSDQRHIRLLRTQRLRVQRRRRGRLLRGLRLIRLLLGQRLSTRLLQNQRRSGLLLIRNPNRSPRTNIHGSGATLWMGILPGPQRRGTWGTRC
jgi:hypothetical protein